MSEHLRSKLKAALDLAAQGFAVFPLQINGKKPALHGGDKENNPQWRANWRNVATTDPDKITRLWTDPVFDTEIDHNIGIALGANTLVVDVDVRDGKPGEESLQLLAARNMTLPHTTRTVLTASGGRHLYYQIDQPGSFPANLDNLVGQKECGIDLKQEGGYVVGPGSVIDGNPYTSTGEQTHAKAPEWLEGLRGSGRKRNDVAPREREPVRKLDTHDAITEAVDYLKNKAPSDGSFQVACEVKDIGISEDKCFELMLEYWPGAETRTFEHVEVRVANAYSYGQNTPGSKRPDPELELEPVEGVALERPGKSPIPGDWPSPAPLDPFDAALLRPRRWIVPEVLARGYVAGFTSPGGMGKTSYTLALLASIAAGRDDPIARKVLERTAAWFWCQEDSLEELQRRLAAVMQVNGLAFSDFLRDGKPMLHVNSGTEKPLLLAHRRPDGKLVHTKQVDQIIRHVREHNIGVFALDPLVEFHEANENDNAEMKTVIAAARRIAIEGDCAVLVVAHTRKPTEASSEGFVGTLDSTRGASSQAFAMRLGCTLFSMSEKDAKAYGVSDDDRRLYARLDAGAKANLTLPTGKPQWFKRESVVIGNGETVGALVPVDLNLRTDPKEQARASLIQDVFDCMPASGKITVPEMARELATLPMRADEKPRSIETAIRRVFADPVQQGSVEIALVTTSKGRPVLQQTACDSDIATKTSATVADGEKT